MSQPLAERMRPRTLEQYIGQKHLVGKGAVLRNMIEARRVSSFLCGGLREWARQRWRRLWQTRWRCRSTR